MILYRMILHFNDDWISVVKHGNTIVDYGLNEGGFSDVL
jgi:hypothetical protein